MTGSDHDDHGDRSDYDELDCSAVLADVWLFLDDECDQATRQRLRRHMQTCPACLEAYGIEEKLKYLLERKCGGEHAPERLRRRVSVQIRSTVASSRGGYSEVQYTESRYDRWYGEQQQSQVESGDG